MSQLVSEASVETPARPVITGEATPEDRQMEAGLRPRSLSEYVGQSKITNNLT
ncbi:MAG: hypothetical protein WKF74_14835 [Pyrinomonadaceae bacterium]